MPRIDPQQLLTCLTPLLAQNGGIKSAGEVIRLANLMEKYSKKLVSKCIYIQILKCTETDLLGQFMAAGGWNLVHNWLSDGVKYNNLAFIQELLEMLLLCPVDGNRLKSNHTPKIVKNLSISCEQQTVKILSLKLVEQWLRIAHQEKQLLAAAAMSNGTEEKPLADEVKADVGSANGTEKTAESKSEDENSGKKSSSENIKYKVNNKESSGKLLLTLKRSTSPSIDEKDSKVSRTSNESKSKSSSSSKSSSTSDKEKEKKSGGSSSSSSSSHRSSSKSSHKDKERSSSHHKSSSKDKHSSSSSRSSSSKRSSSRDKDRKKDSNDKEKSQAEKDKETLDFLTPMPSAKLQRIPKRQHSDNSENKSAESNDASPTNKAAEKKKPSISIEVRKGDKPKTVKTLNSQFRNHGLAEEPPKPPSRKDLKKPSTLAAVSSVTPTAAKSQISPPPAKKIHLDTNNVPEREGGVKLIKPKPMIIESIGFMDALSASAVAKKDIKKKKRLPSNSTSKKDEPESPKIDVKPLKFYKDTLEENEDEAANGEKSPSKETETSLGEANVESKEEPPVKVETSDEVKTEKFPENETDVPEEKRKPGIGCGPDGPPGVLVDPNMPRRKKRPIRWRSEEELTEIRFFELDETERANVTKTFTEQKQIEHGEERSAFKLGQRLATQDTMVEQTKWRLLIVVDNLVPIDYGSKSREMIIQAEREKNVLQELYLGTTLNESPKEPDHESYEHVEAQIIPQEDVTGNPDSVTNFTDIPWPTPKGELPSTFSSNAFANVFSGVNIGIPPTVAISNPLVAFANPPNPIIPPPWLVQQPPFMQPPPNIIPQGPPGFGNRGGMNHNNFRGNSRPFNNNNNNGGNWVRGNSRRGICNQFQRTGVCRNKSCPYVHER